MGTKSQEADRNTTACWMTGTLSHKVFGDPRLQAMRERDEQCLVRESHNSPAICQATTPELAKWIVERLNRCAKYERIGWNLAPVDYATLILTNSGNLHDKLEAIVNQAFHLGAAARMTEVAELETTVHYLRNELQTAQFHLDEGRAAKHALVTQSAAFAAKEAKRQAEIADLKQQLQTAKGSAARLAELAVAPLTRGRFG